jgi:hypothetical protein
MPSITSVFRNVSLHGTSTLGDNFKPSNLGTEIKIKIRETEMRKQDIVCERIITFCISLQTCSMSMHFSIIGNYGNTFPFNETWEESENQIQKLMHIKATWAFNKTSGYFL